jgi:hypothetical protein
MLLPKRNRYAMIQIMNLIANNSGLIPTRAAGVVSGVAITAPRGFLFFGFAG